MPFTSNRQFKNAPRLLVAAKDMHYTNSDGQKILDGTAGLWCVNAGHGRTPIIDAVQTQVATMDYAPGFQMGHPLSFALSARLAAIMPEDLDHVFFTNSGSEAADTALLLIFDEVITGFGRLGAAFACERFNTIPDLLTCAKGLTNATVPMGAVVARKEIYETVIGNSDQPIELFHGYTYSGHPLACAAGLATLELYRSEELFQRAFDLETYWEEAFHSLQSSPHVIDIRNFGLVAGIELEPRPDAPTARAFETFLKCYDDGVLIRTTGDTIALSPPLIIKKNQIDQIVSAVEKCLRSIT